MKRILWVVMGMLIGMGAVSVWAQASAKPPVSAPGAPQPPTCEQQLNEETFKVGGLMQQLAVAREQLRFATKERDEAKAAIVKAAPLPATEKK